MSHRTNLVVQALSNLPLVFKIETLLQALHLYFISFPKGHLKNTKLAEIMETSGLKILAIGRQGGSACLNLSNVSYWRTRL
jgi:hypothetical protein